MSGIIKSKEINQTTYSIQRNSFIPLAGYFTPYKSIPLPSKLEGYEFIAKEPIILSRNFIGEGVIHAYTKLSSARVKLEICFRIPYIRYEIWRCTINKGETVYIGTGNTIGAKMITFNKRIGHV